jgi:catalase
LPLDADAQDFARDAFRHLKAIFVDDEGLKFLKANGIAPDDAVTQNAADFIEAAKTRQWDREVKVRAGVDRDQPSR